MTRGKDPSRLVTVTNALQLLKQFHSGDAELGVLELSRRMGISKSAVSRMVTTFVEEAILERNPRTGKYHLSPLLLELGLIAEEHDPLLAEIRPLIEHLAAETGFHTSFHLRDDHELICIAACGTNGPAPGERAALWETLCGLTILAFSEDHPQRWLEQHADTATTPRLPRGPAQLAEVLAEIDQTGYAIGPELTGASRWCVVCPVFNDTGRAVAALALTGLPIDQQALRAAVLVVGKTAQQLAQRMGSFFSRG
ncbi:MAG: helix-turn-helix domain-containing protein [Alicyclobacillus herbarius]|uniref:IclR family transcriptional regulator n=1 Tax=Alicyclobacillus herbarius TaxID=122960 RepID=UPI00235532BD|nr:helix-turn-helix domain-containing protein [Alicyclobacillus herbarius]MCL6633891.1 helix-turn-helix domain-containing protein [Alicyclobacillus herbarius]